MLTAFDKQLLNIIQTDLPLATRPFAVLAEKLGTSEVVVLSRLQYLKDQGYIRRIGPFFDSARLGYTGTLVAMKVHPDYLPEVAAAINVYPGVTHNYERGGEYNLWFTLLATDRDSERQILDCIAHLSGVEKLINLPAAKKYKVNVQFVL